MKTDNKIQRSPFLLVRHRTIAALLALALLSLRPAFADQGLEKQIKFDYLEKVLTLRHFYSGEHLKFRSDGTLDGYASVGPWTLDGQIEIEDIHLHGARLLIKGRRIRRVFVGQKPEDQLATVRNASGKQQRDLEKVLQHLKLEIQIELPNQNPDEKDVSAAIHAVFLTGSESMLDIVPTCWQGYFARFEGKPRIAPETKKAPAFRVGGGVSAPRASYAPDPEYSDEARTARFMGTVVLYLIVDSSGAAADVQIIRPLGLGLDEKAVNAVRSWKFSPAEKDGEPVPVAINVEVNFHLYQRGDLPSKTILYRIKLYRGANNHAHTERTEARAKSKRGRRARRQCSQDSEGTAAEGRRPSRTRRSYNQTGDGSQHPGHKNRRVAVIAKLFAPAEVSPDLSS
jgi:TonB family protein